LLPTVSIDRRKSNVQCLVSNVSLSLLIHTTMLPTPKHTRHFLLFTLIFSLCSVAHAQDAEEEPKNWTLGGYIKYLNSVNYQEVDGIWLTDNFFHNRLNFKWYASNSLTVSIENRNRFFWGETVKAFPGYAELINTETGWVDMSHNLLEEQSFFLHSTIDRAYVDWTQGNWQIRAGRQRINWGQSYVWNPNDLFNAYSFFDFDYEERPGADALLVRYYTGVLSSVEVAYAPRGTWDESTLAGMFRFNQWSYDFQVLAGKMRDDWVLGMGWAGQLGTAGFKGEISYFQPNEAFLNQPGTMLATMSVDYTFPNSFYLQTEVLYNSGGSPGKPGAFDFTQELTAKTLSLTQLSVFGQAAYQITPLIRLSMSSIYSPNDQSFFVGPGADISVTDNIGLLLTGQVFSGPDGSQFGQAGTFIFGRVKWSF